LDFNKCLRLPLLSNDFYHLAYQHERLYSCISWHWVLCFPCLWFSWISQLWG
jgi:hypothetical protein